MRIEVHAAVPIRFQDTKPTVESNELQTNQIELHRSLSVPMDLRRKFPVRSLESSDARIVFGNRIAWRCLGVLKREENSQTIPLNYGRTLRIYTLVDMCYGFVNI
jgi:hypothetical protein